MRLQKKIKSDNTKHQGFMRKKGNKLMTTGLGFDYRIVII